MASRRSYSDPTYGGRQFITIGGLAGATQTLATNGVYASHNFTFPCRVIGAKMRFMGNGITSGFTDLTQNTEFQLFRSTDSGTGLETVMGTADGLGATGTWLPEDAGLNQVDFTLTETDFNDGDSIIFTAEGAWDDPINLLVDIMYVEKFDNADS